MSTSQRVLAAVVMLALSGCTGPEPTQPPSTPPATSPTMASTTAEPPDSPTPSPSEDTEPTAPPSPSATGSATSTATTDPAEDAARFATVVPAFEQYWSVINETYAAGGAAEATPGMRDTMTGDQLTYWVDAFAKFKAAENSYSGQNKVVYATTKSVALKPDDGTATVEFCVDMSQTRAVDVDGRPLKKEGLFQKGVAGLLWREGRWKVAGFLEGTGFVAQC